AELADRVGMVVHAQVDPAIVAAAVAATGPDDEDRGGLPAAPIAAGLVGCLQTCDQALGERSATGGERVDERVDDRRSSEDVSLRGVTRPRPAASPCEAAAARPRRGPSGGVDDPGLAVGPQVVCGDEPIERVLGARTAGDQVEAGGAVGD